jgi:hypothetical protein
MALINNGWQRAETLKITKTVGAEPPTVYTHDLKQNFTANGRTHALVTTEQLMQLSTEAYTQRASDFAAYVPIAFAAQYPGINTISANAARTENQGNCPIGAL